MLRNLPASLLPLLLAAATAPVAASSLPAPSGPAAVQDPLDPPLGTLGYVPPEVTDVRMKDTVPHQDQVGGNTQLMTALCGASGGGFAAVWRDQRDGSLGLYMVRLGPDGVQLEPERSACVPHTMRRVDPAIALASDGSGIVSWTSVIGAGQVPWVRCFAADGTFPREETTTVPPEKPNELANPRGRGDNDLNCRMPAITRLASGKYAVAWTRGGKVQFCEVTASGDIISPMTELRGVADVEPGVLLSTNADGAMLCVWETKKGGSSTAMAALRGASAPSIVPIGEGIPQGLERDPAGGFFVLVALGERSVLRHLGRDAKPDRADVVLEGAPVLAHQIAVHETGVAVMQDLGAPSAGDASDAPKGRPARGERAERSAPKSEGKARGVVLTLCDASGNPIAAAFDVPSAEAKGVQSPRLASNGKSLLVGWTDFRAGDPDVYGRIVDPAAAADARLGPERRLNTDVGSADQIQPTVAAHGERGLVAWVDKRAAPVRVYARRFGPEGFTGDELALPLALGDEAAPLVEGGVVHPEAAMRPNGDALVCWKHQLGKGRGRLIAQVVGESGARSSLLEIDAGKDGEVLDAAVVALPAEKGFYVVWARSARGGVWGRRVGGDGKLAGNAKRISAAGEFGEDHPDVALLDDGRLVCAWTRIEEGKPWSIRARVLDDGGELRGEEMSFEHTRRGVDWDPSLAPAENNGFAMAWTAGAMEDTVRDVVVRLFDAQGRAKSPLATPCFGANEQDWSDVVRLPDKTFAVAWEDDVSFYDQVYVRRLAKDGKSMGTMMRLHRTESSFMPDRVSPRIAVFGSGLAAAFGDRHRSLGFDAVLKVVGAKWDDAPPWRAR